MEKFFIKRKKTNFGTRRNRTWILITTSSLGNRSGWRQPYSHVLPDLQEVRSIPSFLNLEEISAAWFTFWASVRGTRRPFSQVMQKS